MVPPLPPPRPGAGAASPAGNAASLPPCPAWALTTLAKTLWTRQQHAGASSSSGSSSFVWGPTYPHGVDDGLLWWFLRDRHLDVAEAVLKLQHCLQWRRAFRVDYLGPENFSAELRSRKAYLHQHADIVGRPVLVVIAQRHNLMKRRLEESCRMCAWFMERMMDRLATAEPPKPATSESDASGDLAEEAAPFEAVEQALGIIDLQGFSPLQADLEFAVFLVQALHDYYPGRFARILLVDAPDIFRSFWENVRPLLHRYATLADFVTAEEVRSRYFYKPDLAPAELQGR